MELSGKTCLITGANSGLGLATTKKFARLGAHVILVCRDGTKGEAAIAEVKKEVPNASLSAMVCDLSSISSVKRFTEEFKESQPRLDILYNNAAVLNLKRTQTGDGLEMMFQTNYLAPFLITTSLLDVLKSNTPSQVINIAHPPEKLQLNFEDLQSSQRFVAMDAFMRSKLCLLLFTLELSRRVKGSGVSVNAGDPGPFKSKLARNVPWPFGMILGLTADSADRASESVVFMATSVNGDSGKVFLKKQELPLAPYWCDQVLREKLWLATEDILEQTQKSTAKR